MIMDRIYKNIIVFLVLILWISCKGKIENHTTEVIKTDHVIHYVTYGTNPEAEKSFEYNGQGDVVKYIVYMDTITYTYTDKTIEKNHSNKSADWLAYVSYTLDKSGRIIGSNAFDENKNCISNTLYAYDMDGYLIKTDQTIMETQRKYVNTYEYKDGNLLEIQTYTFDGRLSSKYVYQYYEDKIDKSNMFLQGFTDDYFTNDRFGRKNKNLLNSSANIGIENDTLSYVTYSYAEETAKNILSIFQSDDLNGFETEIIYHYMKPKK